MNKDRAALALETEEDLAEESERSVYLRHGRTLVVTTQGVDELIEIRASSGQVELRLVMTEEGPVLRLDGVRLAVNAAEAVEMSCKTFSVNASESIQLASQGELGVQAEGEMTIESPKDVRVRGEKIWLN